MEDELRAQIVALTEAKSGAEAEGEEKLRRATEAAAVAAEAHARALSDLEAAVEVRQCVCVDLCLLL